MFLTSEGIDHDLLVEDYISHNFLELTKLNLEFEIA